MDTALVMALAMVLAMQSEDPPLPQSLIRSPPLPASLSEAMVLVTDTALVMALVTDPPSELLEFPLFRPLEESESLVVTELDMAELAMALATVMEMEVPDSIDQVMS